MHQDSVPADFSGGEENLQHREYVGRHSAASESGFALFRGKSYKAKSPFEIHGRIIYIGRNFGNGWMTVLKVAVGVLIRDGRLLACQRKRGFRHELKWEFPGGKVETGESIHQTLSRELREELGITNIQLQQFSTITSSYPDDSRFSVTFCRVSSFDGTPTNNAFETIRWVTPSELRGLDMLEGNKQFIDSLLHEIDLEHDRF